MGGNDKALVLLSAIVENGCRSASEIDGDLSCFFCGGWENIGSDEIKHDEDCPYILAKRYLEENE